MLKEMDKKHQEKLSGYEFKIQKQIDDLISAQTDPLEEKPDTKLAKDMLNYSNVVHRLGDVQKDIEKTKLLNKVSNELESVRIPRGEKLDSNVVDIRGDEF